jgi:hypothetical protein
VIVHRAFQSSFEKTTFFGFPVVPPECSTIPWGRGCVMTWLYFCEFAFQKADSLITGRSVKRNLGPLDVFV